MIKGKTAIITGGSRGIGAAVARKLASEGADLAILYERNHAAASEVAAFCEREFGVTARTYCASVADHEAVKETVSKIRGDFGGAAILINNAGITRDGLACAMKQKDFDDVLDTNLKGAFYMIRHCAPLFLRAKEGVIVNISSVSGLMGNAGQCNYSASKAGLIGLTKSVAKELAPKGIRCNAVAPGFIETDMTRSEEGNPLTGMIPLRRMGTPEEVAEAVLYLVNATYVTGEVLRVDGGIAM